MLPLILLPRRIVFIDDEEQYLAGMQRRIRTLSSNMSGQFYSSPMPAFAAFNEEQKNWKHVQNSLVACMSDSAHHGKSLLVLLAENYFNNWKRFCLTTVMVVDYQMREMNGLDFLRKLESGPTSRIMLTGIATQSTGLEAFMEGRIHQFIEKSQSDLHNRLRDQCQSLHERVCHGFGQLMLPNLQGSQTLLISNKRVESGLQRQIEALEWVEYLIIGQPFGILGMRSDGPLQWLQLETQESLQDMVAVAQEQGCTDAVVREIKNGTALIDTQIALEFGMVRKPKVLDAIEICANPLVLGAVTDLDVKVINNEQFGIDDIMDPLDELRALMRHSIIGQSQVDTLQQEINEKPSASLQRLLADANERTESAIRRFHELTQTSIVSKSAADKVMTETRMSPSLAVRYKDLQKP